MGTPRGQFLNRKGTEKELYVPACWECFREDRNRPANASAAASAAAVPVPAEDDELEQAILLSLVEQASRRSLEDQANRLSLEEEDDDFQLALQLSRSDY